MKIVFVLFIAFLGFSISEVNAQCSAGYTNEQGYDDGYALGQQSLGISSYLAHRTFNSYKRGRRACTDYIEGLNEGWIEGRRSQQSGNARPSDGRDPVAEPRCWTIVKWVYGEGWIKVTTCG